MIGSRPRRLLVAVIAAQALVLVLLPLLAGPRIPSGTTVTLAATEARMDVPAREKPAQELFLDYGFDELELPEATRAGDVVYVELLDADDDRAARFGRVVQDEDALPDGAIWIKLPVFGQGDGELGAGSIEMWFDPDAERIARLREHLASSDDARVLVTVHLDNDGDPLIEGVRAAD